MVEFNKIGFTAGVNYTNSSSKSEKETTENTSKEQKSNTNVNYQSADDVLSYMANTSTVNPTSVDNSEGSKTSRTIEVSKYISSDDAKRIAGYVQDFEGSVKNSISVMNKEFGSLSEYAKMSDSAKTEIAVKAFLENNMPDAAEDLV